MTQETTLKNALSSNEKLNEMQQKKNLPNEPASALNDLEAQNDLLKRQLSDREDMMQAIFSYISSTLTEKNAEKKS
jgi:hypothetical protein